MLSSSPAAPSITGTHLADAVKSFGSVEADSSTSGSNMVKPARRASALTSNGSPVESTATPAKKTLDVHSLFTNKPSASEAPAPSADRRPPTQSFQTPSGLPGSNQGMPGNNPYQPQMIPGQPNLRPPPPGGMLGSSPRSPILGNNLPPSQFSAPQIQQGFRPMMNNPGQVRPNGPGGPMQGQRQGMMMGQGVSQYGMHPGQQGGPGYPMGYAGQPNYYVSLFNWNSSEHNRVSTCTSSSRNTCSLLTKVKVSTCRSRPGLVPKTRPTARIPLYLITLLCREAEV